MSTDTEIIDGGRRAFLRGGAVTRESRERIAAQATPLGPAPPGLLAVIADGHCTECAGPCLDSCPQTIIRRHPAGHAHLGEPWLQFTAGHCTFCGDCLRACPPAEQTSLDAPTPIGQVSLSHDSCLAWNQVVCVSCRFACDTGAISVDASARPSIQAERCTGCGACVSRCPQDALTVAPMPHEPRGGPDRGAV